DFVQAAVTGVLLVTFWLGYASMPVVLIILAIRAIAQGFHSPATQAIIPLMVPREQYQIVTSYNYLFNSAIFLVGPMVGAVLVEWVGVDNLATILWVDMISFLMAVIPLALITIPDITKEKREAKEKTSFRQEFREGISFIVKAKGLLPLLLTFTLINILVTPVMMLMPLVAVADNLLAGTATTLAIIMISNQGGTFSGSFLLTRFTPFRQNVRGVAIGQFAIYLGVLGMAVGAMLGNLWVVAAFAFVDGLGMPIANIHSQNVWLSVVPPELQGRVMSVRQAIAWIMIPVAQFAGGILADRFGILTVYYGGAAIGLVALTLAWYLTSFPRVEAILGLDVEPVVPSIEMAEPVVTTDT
ncbi:MAG: MFS transporter, partial [Candidatus Kariarchaeaceae archaeon]